MPNPLTERQQAILDFIQTYETEHKKRPSLSLIQRHFGFASLHAVRQHIILLEKKGCLVWPKKFVVADQSTTGGGAAGGAAWLPFSMEASADGPADRLASTKPHLLVDKTLLPDTGDFFVFKVTDDRMIDAEIREGDILIVNREATPPSGKIVVVRVGERVLVQRFVRHSGGKHTFRSENTAYDDIKVSPELSFSLEGVVVGLLRSTL